MQGSWLALCRRVGLRMSRQGPGRSRLTFNMTHACRIFTRNGREKKSNSDPHCWSRKFCRISFHTHVQHVWPVKGSAVTWHERSR